MSGLVIGKARFETCGAVELFGQHDPHQAVRPGLDTKGHCLRDGLAHGFAIAFSAANHETEIGQTFVALGG